MAHERVLDASGPTSVDKSLEICEALSGQPTGLSLSHLARSVHMPPPTVHRLLSILKRRGYVRQNDETARYRLTLKVLDLGFRLLGRSELKLHAYPVLREYTLRTRVRCFIAAQAGGEVTYIWGIGRDEVAMHTAYGKEMPARCELYFNEAHARRRLSCLRLVKPSDVADSAEVVTRLAGRCGAVGRGTALDLHVRTGAGFHGSGGRPCGPVRARTGRRVDSDRTQPGRVGTGPPDFDASGPSTGPVCSCHCLRE